MKSLHLLMGGLLIAATVLANDTKVIYYPNGQKHFEYQTRKAIMNGSFASFYENGKQKLSGAFINNQKTGVWTAWDDKGTMRAQRRYTDNYSFEIIREWDSTGAAIADATIKQKNTTLSLQRSEPIRQKNISYLHRYFKEIPADNSANAFLYEDNNAFFKFLATQVALKSMKVFKDSRFAYIDTSISKWDGLRYFNVVSFIIKEDLIYTSDHQVMHNKALGICPVAMIGGERKELGWFYLPDVPNNRFVTKETEKVINTLQQRNYAGTVTKTDDDSKDWSIREVSARQSDSLTLRPLDFEAAAWIRFIDTEWPAQQ